MTASAPPSEAGRIPKGPEAKLHRTIHRGQLKIRRPGHQGTGACTAGRAGVQQSNGPAPTICRHFLCRAGLCNPICTETSSSSPPISSTTMTCDITPSFRQTEMGMKHMIMPAKHSMKAFFLPISAVMKAAATSCSKTKVTMLLAGCSWQAQRQKWTDLVLSMKLAQHTCQSYPGRLDSAVKAVATV